MIPVHRLQQAESGIIIAGPDKIPDPLKAFAALAAIGGTALIFRRGGIPVVHEIIIGFVDFFHFFLGQISQGVIHVFVRVVLLHQFPVSITDFFLGGILPDTKYGAIIFFHAVHNSFDLTRTPSVYSSPGR